VTASWTLPLPTWRPGNREYHAHPALSSTQLKTFRESPEMFRRRRAGEVEAEPMTAPMILGSAVHTLLTEPERAESELYIVKGAQTRRGNKVKDAQAARPHQLCLSEDEAEEAHGIAGAILEPRTGSAALAKEILLDCEGIGEYAYRWDEVVDGVVIPCRLKIDRLVLWGGYPMAVELKSIYDASPEEVGRVFEATHERGYGPQAAFYARGLKRFLGEAWWPATIPVAVHNNAPYEVFVSQLPDETLQEGAEVVEADLRKLAACLKLPPGVPWCHCWEQRPDGALPKTPRPRWKRGASEESPAGSSEPATIIDVY